MVAVGEDGCLYIGAVIGAAGHHAGEDGGDLVEFCGASDELGSLEFTATDEVKGGRAGQRECDGSWL